MNVLSNQEAEFIQYMVNKGGPEKNEYAALNSFLTSLGDKVRKKIASRKEINTELWRLMGRAMSLNTMQGKVAIKPHGYAGDFELIDQIYTQWISDDPDLKNWDYFFHAQPATIAVRNRKQYFIKLMKEITQSGSNESQVLNIGCGPSRDIYEYYQQVGHQSAYLDCLDMDEKAIQYSKQMCRTLPEQITFYCKNVFRFKTKKRYDLVWSAGLFDYLDDKKFIFLLSVLMTMARKGGHVVIGNFSTENPTRDCMESADWFLYHRSEKDLHELAKASGALSKNISVKSEAEGVNLFLHIQV